MKERLFISLFLIFINYTILVLLSYLLYSTFNLNDIGSWGLVSGFILLVCALPIHKITYFGGRGLGGVQSPEVPPDEHLHQKIHKQYEKETKIKPKHQDILTITGLAIIVISIFLI
ncbi:hypothetical protein V1502_10610 [Bacillus sp. SCS-153A]|uniref:hypothetical protein n=1 Tax=Rossellomorea sedimentorum TaxID=3115294 RepID=UPI00390609E5